MVGNQIFEHDGLVAMPHDAVAGWTYLYESCPVVERPRAWMLALETSRVRRVCDIQLRELQPLRKD